MNLNGVQPCIPDHRDYSCRTFGIPSKIVFQEQYSCEAGFRFPDQMREGLPQGCTGYTSSELCQDEDLIQYQPRYTYDKTLFMENSTEGQPCNVRDSLKTTIMWGVLPNTTSLNSAAINFTDSTDSEAAKHKRAAFYVIELNAGMDWFDTMRNMLWAGRVGRRSISIVTPWYSEWTNTNVNSTGIVSVPASWAWEGSHNWKISGWKTINGVPYLVAKTWQGSLYGDRGVAYFSREIMNKVMEQYGSCGFMLFEKVSAADVKLIELTWVDWVKSHIRLIQSKL